MEQEQRQLAKKYIDLFLRRKKLIILCTMIAIIAGVGLYMKMPKRYKATSLIIYQHQNINLSKMSLDVKTQTREMVDTLTQQVTSRTSLEQIIKQFGLYVEALKRLPMQDVVIQMRENIKIVPSMGDVFQVEFIGSDPQKVMLVTNALAAKFIEENLRFREEKASETSAYVKDELSMSKSTLDQKEELMRDYKLKYYNEMPQQLQINMSRLNSLQAQLQSNQEGQRDLERTKILIQEQISSRVEVLAKTHGLVAQDNTENATMAFPEGESRISIDSLSNKRNLSDQETALLNLLRELESLQATFSELSSKYTSTHPEIKKLTRLLAAKEQEQAKLVAMVRQGIAHENNESDHVGTLPERRSSQMPVRVDNSQEQLDQLKLQLKEVTFNNDMLKEGEKAILHNIETYQAWISATPIREAEWAALTRDYEQLQSHYQELVSRNINAESVESLERRQKGSQFKIVDSAHLPEKPFTPNFMKIMLLAVGLGFGVGGGTALLLETIQSSFKDAMDLETYLDIPVICAIPFVQTSREKKYEKIKIVLWWFAFCLASAAISLGTIYLWYKGLIII